MPALAPLGQGEVLDRARAPQGVLEQRAVPGVVHVLQEHGHDLDEVAVAVDHGVTELGAQRGGTGRGTSGPGHGRPPERLEPGRPGTQPDQRVVPVSARTLACPPQSVTPPRIGRPTCWNRAAPARGPDPAAARRGPRSVTDQSDAFVHEDPAASRALRARLRALMAEHLPQPWLGPFTDDPADFEISNRFCEVLAAEGLLVPNWPAAYGGQDLDLASSIVIREEMWANFEPRGGQYYGPNWIGPSILDYGTEEQKALHLPLIAVGPGLVVPGLQRARRRLRPRQHEDEGGARRRRLPHQRPEDVDVVGAVGQVVLPARAGRGRGRRREPPRRRHRLPAARWTARASPSAASTGSPAPTTSARCSSTTCGSTGPRCSATSATGGRSSATRCRTNGSASRGTRATTASSPTRSPTTRFRDALPASRWLTARVRNRMARLMCRRALWFQRDGGSHDFVVSAARMITTRSNLLVADTLAEALGDHFFENRYTDDAALDGAGEFFWRYMQAGPIASGTTEMLQRGLSRAMFAGERIRVTDDVDEVRASIDKLAAAHGGVDAARRAIIDPARPGAAARRPRRDHRRARPARRALRGPGRRRGLPGRGSRGAAGAGRGDAAAPCRRARRWSRSPPRALRARRPLRRLATRSTADGAVRAVAARRRAHRLEGRAVREPRRARRRRRRRAAHRRWRPLLLHALPAWYLLGAAEQALDLATVYATERVQFGSPDLEVPGRGLPARRRLLRAPGPLRARPLHDAPRVRHARRRAGRRARVPLGGARHRARACCASPTR